MSGLEGAGSLLRLWLRRDRVMVPVWVLALAATLASTAASFTELYGVASERHAFAAGIAGNGATLALYGPVHADSLGGLVAWRMGVIGATFTALMSVFLVIRHSRAEEESGRLELLGSAALGRRAPLASAVGVAVLANAVLAVLAALALRTAGLAWTGSAAFALSWLAAGLAFTGVAALSAQLSDNTRTARGIALAALGTVFLVRAAGDAAGWQWLSWLSPLGWTSLTRPFAGERWWVPLLSVLLLAALTTAAFALSARRDLGAGILPPRLGPARGRLGGTTALAWRLQRGSFGGWMAGFAVYGAVIGGVARNVSDLVGESTQTREVLARFGGRGGLSDVFLAATFGIISLIAAAYGVQAVLRLRGEETAGRLEPLLATGTGRLRWAAGHTAVAFAGTAVMLLTAGFTCGLVYALTTTDPGQIGRLTAAGSAQVPAAWVATAAALLLFGAAPRAAQAAWGLLGACLLLSLLGPALRLPQAALDLSPFTHTPRLPGGPVQTAPLLALLAITAALSAVGFATWRRRDLSP